MLARTYQGSLCINGKIIIMINSSNTDIHTCRLSSFSIGKKKEREKGKKEGRKKGR